MLSNGCSWNLLASNAHVLYQVVVCVAYSGPSGIVLYILGNYAQYSLGEKSIYFEFA